MTEERGNRDGTARDQVVLANERTYAAWIRTGLALLVSGLAVERFMLDSMPSWSAHVIAVILTLLAAIAFLVAGWRYTHLGLRLAPDVPRIPNRWVVTSSIMLAFVCILSALALWALDPASR